MFRPGTVLTLLLALASAPAWGANAYNNYGMKLDYSLELGTGVFAVSNAQFGGGQDSDPSTSGDRSPDWSELYMLPKITGELAMEASATLYGEFSMVATTTTGDGDASGSTVGTPSDFRTESFLVGWKSGKALPDYGMNALDLYAGRGRLVIGDGFIVGDGVRDQGEMGCYWLAPHSNFRRVAAARTNTKPLKGDLFYLSTDGTQYNTEGFGLNGDYTFERYGSVGAMVLFLTDSELESRDGMRVVELRYMGNPFVGRDENAWFNAQVAFESNGGKANASAYVFELGYNLPWKESAVSLRYGDYSGDAKGTSKMEGFDPLFQKEFARGWGTWLEGEIVGEYYWGNTDKRTIMAAFRFKPVPTVSAGAILYTFDRSRGGRHIADELDFYADWSVGANLVISGAYAHATPGSVPREDGLDRSADLVELAAIVAF